MKEEGCKSTSECSDKQRSQGNGLGSPGEPLGACDYSVRGVYMGPKFYARVAMSHDKKCLSHDNNFKTVSVAC